MTPVRLFPLMLLALAACQEETADTCGAEDHQDLVGRAPGMMGMMDIPLDARIIGPNDAVTQDHNPERLNIYYDADNLITRVSCG